MAEDLSIDMFFLATHGCQWEECMILVGWRIGFGGYSSRLFMCIRSSPIRHDLRDPMSLKYISINYSREEDDCL